MTPTKLLIGQILIVFAIVIAGLVNDAVAAWLARRGSKEVDDLLKVRLDRMSREIGLVRRDIDVVLESLSLFVRYQLLVTAPLPEADSAALAIGLDRFTDIALEPGEVLGAVASGDTARWVIGDTTSGAGAGKRVHILVKPYAAGLSTNLVITTDRRTYHLALTSVRSVGMSVLTWTYPQDTLLAIKRSEEAAAAAAPVAAGLDVDQLHFNYAISGDTPRWRPLRAFDDGRQTYIEFPASLAVGEAPPLFLVGAKGEAQLVNYRVRGRYYVVDRLFDVAELRLGTKHQDVVRLTRVDEAGRRSRSKGRAS